MQCPRCGVPLGARTQVGVVVDACGRCRGVWLDRGELETIVAAFHSHAREKAARRAGPHPGEARGLSGRHRMSTWARLKQLFDSDR